MKELDKLKFLNENLILIQKKKDEILAVALDENRKLHEEIDCLKNVLKSRSLQIEQMKKNGGVRKAANKPTIPKEKPKVLRRTFTLTRQPTSSRHQSSTDLTSFFSAKSTSFCGPFAL